MLTKTVSSAYIELTPDKLGEILSKHFENELKMVPTETEFVFSNRAGEIRQYVSTITFVARKIETFETQTS